MVCHRSQVQAIGEAETQLIPRHVQRQCLHRLAFGYHPQVCHTESQLQAFLTTGTRGQAEQLWAKGPFAQRQQESVALADAEWA